MRNYIIKVYATQHNLVLVLYMAVFAITLMANYSSPLRVFSDSDVADYFYPHMQSAYESFQVHDNLGSFYYSPFSQAGYFTDTSGQLQTYYPIKYLLALVSHNVLIFEFIYYIFHVTLAFYGMRKWLLRNVVSPFNASVASMFYITAPLFVSWQALYHSLAFFAFAPLILTQFEQIVLDARHRVRNSVQLLVLSGFLVTGSHLQNIYILCVFITFFFLLSFFSAPSRLRLSLCLSINIVVLVIGTFIVWHPFVNQMSMSMRTPITQEQQVNLDINAFLPFFSEFLSNSRITNINMLFAPAPIAVLFLTVYLFNQRILRNFSFKTSIGFRYLLACLFLLACSSGTDLGGIFSGIVPMWGYQSNTQRISFVILPVLILYLAKALELSLAPSRYRHIIFFGFSTFFIVYEWDQIYGFRIILAISALCILFFWVSFSQSKINAAILLLVLSSFATPVSSALLSYKPNSSLVEKYSKLTNVVDEFDDGGLWITLCQPIEPYRFKTSANLLSKARFLDSYDSFVTRNYFEKMKEISGESFTGNPVGGQWYQGTSLDVKANPKILKDNFITRIILGPGCAIDSLEPIYGKLAAIDGYTLLGVRDYSGYQVLPSILSSHKKIFGNYYLENDDSIVLAIKYDKRIRMLDYEGKRIVTEPYRSFFTKINKDDISKIKEVKFLPLIN